MCWASPSNLESRYDIELVENIPIWQWMSKMRRFDIPPSGKPKPQRVGRGFQRRVHGGDHDRRLQLQSYRHRSRSPTGPAGAERQRVQAARVTRRESALLQGLGESSAALVAGRWGIRLNFWARELIFIELLLITHQFSLFRLGLLAAEGVQIESFSAPAKHCGDSWYCVGVSSLLRDLRALKPLVQEAAQLSAWSKTGALTICVLLIPLCLSVLD